MYSSAHTASPLATFLPYLLVVVILVLRYARPMKMSVARVFFAPAVFLLLTGFSIYATQRLAPAPFWAIVPAIVLGALIGIPFGVLSSRHRTVRPTEKPHIMLVDPSWVTLVIWLAAFLLKAGIRALLPQGSAATAVGDGLLVFGLAAIAASYWVIYRKFRALDRTTAFTA